MNQEDQQNHPASGGPTEAAAGPRKMSRREALAIVGKHAIYTAPAVLAVLSVTKAHAEVCNPMDPPPGGCPSS